MELIAISGYLESGKDTTRNYLFRKLEHSYSLKFAKPLKECATALYSTEAISYWEYDKHTPKPELFGKTKRQIMQELGTKIKEAFGQNIFVNLTNLTIQNIIKEWKLNYIIIDDLRFPNELEYIKKNNGIVIYIERDLNFSDKHESESHYEYIKKHSDFILYNNKTKQDLYKQIDIIIDYLNS